MTTNFEVKEQIIIKRGRGRPRKHYTDEDKARANREGYKKCMQNEDNKKLRNQRYKDWSEKNKVELYARRKIVRDRKKLEESNKIISQIEEAVK